MIIYVKDEPTHEVPEYEVSDVKNEVLTVTCSISFAAETDPQFSRDWNIKVRGRTLRMDSYQPAGKVETNSGLNYTYDLIFIADEGDLKNKTFMVFSDGQAGIDPQPLNYDIPFVGDIDEFAKRFNLNLSYYYGDKYRMEVSPDAERKGPVTVSVSGGSLWDVLISVPSLFGLDYEFASGEEEGLIKVGFAPVEIEHIFEYGSEAGLKSIQRSNDTESIRTRLRCRGSSKNLPYRYFKAQSQVAGEERYPADPDYNALLEYNYYPNLMPKAYRDYIKGWNGTVVDVETDAYVMGKTDRAEGRKFYPTDFLISDNEALWGERYGTLETQEDIYPTIQGVSKPDLGRIDEVVAVEVGRGLLVGEAESILLPESRQSFQAEFGKTVTSYYPIGSFVLKEVMSDVEITFGIQKVSKSGVPFPLWTGQDVSLEMRFIEKETGHIIYKQEYSMGTDYSISERAYTFRTTNILAGEYLIGYAIYITTGSDEHIRQGDPGTFIVSTSSAVTSNEDNRFRIWVKDLGFDLRDDKYWNVNSQDMAVMFSDGALAGDYEFKLAGLKADSGKYTEVFVYPDTTKEYNGVKSAWRIELMPSDAELEASGRYLPNEGQMPKAGDHFFLVNIQLPQSYVENAEQRLDDYIREQLLIASQESTAITVTPSRIFCIDFKEVDKLRAGAKIRIRNERLIGESYGVYWIQSVTLKYTSERLNPEWELAVSAKQFEDETGLSYIQSQITQLSSSIGSGTGNPLNAERYYLRKDGIQDTSYSQTTFKKTVKFNGVQSEDFIDAGMAGQGWSISKDEYGNSVLIVDKMKIRKELIANSATVNQIEFVFGKRIESRGGVVVSRVEEAETGWKCFFDTKNGEVFNPFKADDQIFCQNFNVADKHIVKYYWGLCAEVGTDYFILSYTDKDGEGVPAPGDNAAQLGNRTDATRQSAMIVDQLEGGSLVQYAGIDSYSLVGKEYVGIGFDPTTKEAYLFCYGRGFLGDRDGKSYVKLTKEEGESDYSVKVKGKVTIIGGSSGLDNFDEWKDKQEQIDNATQDAQEAKEAAQNAQQSVTDLEGKFDDIVSDGFVTEAEAIAIQKYINQIKEAFNVVEATYTVLYKNANLSGAPKTNLKSAYDALSTSKDNLITTINQVISDGKATTEEVALVDTKFADYNAKTKVFYQRVEEANDAIRKAIEEIANQALTAAGEAKQEAADAIQAANESKQAVSDLEDTINGSFKDGIITEAEAKAIEKYINLVNESFGDLEAAYNEIYANPYLVDESAKNGLQTAFTGLSQKKDALISAINTAIADGKTTTDEAKAVDTAFEAYNTAVAAFQTAVENANKAIQTYLKGISDAAYEAANQAIQQATEMQQRLDGWAADDVISPAEKESLKNLEKQTLAEYSQIYQEANFWEMTQPSNPHYSKWEAYETAYDNIIAALAKYTAKEPENIPIEDDYGDIQKYYDAKAQILAAIAYVSRERFDDIDKTTEELTAKTKGFTVIDGGLIYSQILNLTEVVGNVSAGASGISKDTEGNPLPAFWAGGTYAEAKGDDTVFVVRHDGSAKFGQVHLDPLGRIVVYEDIPWDWVEAQESVIITSESIPTLDEIAETNINKTVQNTAQTINITATTVDHRELINKVDVEYLGATIAVSTTIKAEYNIFSNQSQAKLKARLTLYLAKDGQPMYELGKVSVDSTDPTSITPSTLLIDNVTNKVPKGRYSLWMAYSAIREGANTFDTLKVSIEASTMTYKYNFSSTQFIIGNGGFVLKSSAFNFLRATYTGLTAKYASGYVDMPGVLVAGRVWNSVAGIQTYKWGAKATGITVSSTVEGTFKFTHNWGHTNYYVVATLESVGFISIDARNTTSFYIETKDTSGKAKGMSFQFAVFGDNR